MRAVNHTDVSKLEYTDTVGHGGYTLDLDSTRLLQEDGHQTGGTLTLGAAQLFLTHSFPWLASVTRTQQK